MKLNTKYFAMWAVALVMTVIALIPLGIGQASTQATPTATPRQFCHT